jgi:hypothetical protein
MSRVFKTATFARWIKKSSLTDADLCRSVAEMKRGLIDAHLGGQVVKKRVAPAGRGKSGASRTLVATNLGSRWYFIFGFDKNERSNIDHTELQALQEIAKDLLRLDDTAIASAMAANALVEICHDDEDNKTP